MLNESLFIIILTSLIFLSGVSIGQLILKIKLARIQKENLLLEQKKLAELKKILRTPSVFSRQAYKQILSKEFEQNVKDEIDNLLKDIE